MTTDNSTVNIDEIKIRIEKLRLKLEKRLLDPVKNGADVWIRDILVTQPRRDKDGEIIYGEFNQGEKKLPSGEARKNESEMAAIRRIVRQIQQLANYAKTEHLQANFIPVKKNLINVLSSTANSQRRLLSKQSKIHPDIELFEMKPQANNEITRLSLNEFFFYLCAERGPLSEEGFNYLADKIHALAKELPENLHLVLGTLPVATGYRKFHNVSVYVECGSEPQLHIQAKVNTADNDPNYPNAMNSSHTDYEYEKHFITPKMQNAYDELVLLLVQRTLDNKEIIYYTEQLLSFCTSNLYAAEPALIDKLENLLIDATINALNPAESVYYAKELIFLFEQHKNKVENKFNLLLQQYYGPTYYHFSLSQDKKTISYSYPFESKTKANTPIIIATDICLDHAENETKFRLEKELTRVKRNYGQILPEHVSQIIISNHIGLIEESILTQDKVAVHNNTISPCIGKDGSQLDLANINVGLLSKEISNHQTCFGPAVNIKVYQRRPVKRFHPDYLADIQIINQRTLELKAMTIYREQHPHEFNIVSKLIERKLLEFFLNDINELYDSISDSDIKKIIRDFMNQITLLYSSDTFKGDALGEIYDLKLDLLRNPSQYKEKDGFEDLVNLFHDQLNDELTREIKFTDEITKHQENKNKSITRYTLSKSTHAFWQSRKVITAIINQMAEKPYVKPAAIDSKNKSPNQKRQYTRHR